MKSSGSLLTGALVLASVVYFVSVGWIERRSQSRHLSAKRGRRSRLKRKNKKPDPLPLG